MTSGYGKVLMDETAIASGSLAGDGALLPPNSRVEVTAQIEISSATTASVQIQGRVSDDATWTDLLDAPQDETTATAVYPLAFMPQMRVNATGLTGTPDIRVEVYHG
jgi:hypothetical protein